MTLWVANGIGASLAVVANVWAARFAITRNGRRVRTAVAALSSCYAFGIWSGLTWWDIDSWASWGRAFGLIAWPLVWVLPAVQACVDGYRIVARIEALAANDEAQ